VIRARTNRDRTAVGAVLSRGGFLVSVLFVVFLLVAQRSPALRGQVEALRTQADDLAVSMTAFSNPFESGFDRLVSMWNAVDRVRELEEENRALARWRDAAQIMSERLTRYESLLNLVGEPPLIGVSARVISEMGGPFAVSFIANAGAQNGVLVDSAAVTETGLVGRVIAVGERSSRILSVRDFNSRVPVMGKRTRARGILVGDRSGDPRLLYVSEPDALSEGEVWLTSGDDGSFPRGLLVGTLYSDQGVWRMAPADDSTVDFVRLIPPARLPAPEDNPLEQDDPGAGQAPNSDGGAGQ